jgi:L-lysine 6-transaminase
MSATATPGTHGVHVDPKDVLSSLGRHMLVDGYHIVMDLKRSKGNFVYDALHDVPVLDFFSHFATCPVGYGHPKMTTPEFLEKISWAALTKPANSDIYSQEMAEFVEAFTRIAVPQSHGKHLFFVEGGALANENQLKASFDWKVRKNFRKGHRREELALAQMKQVLLDNRDDVAALIIEPIQGEGGDNHFRPEFFRALRALCDENDMMFLVDEVQTGFGLTGRMWGFESMGVSPDMFSFGKKTQVCGFAANDRIMEEPDNVFVVSSRINSTWGGNLIDMVRCAKYLEIIEEEKLVDNARVVGEHLVKKLEELALEFPGKMTGIRGRGLFIAFDLPDKATRGKVLTIWLQKHNVMGLASGERSIRLRPPLTLTKEEADLGVTRLRAALTEALG